MPIGIGMCDNKIHFTTVTSETHKHATHDHCHHSCHHHHHHHHQVQSVFNVCC